MEDFKQPCVGSDEESTTITIAVYAMLCSIMYSVFDSRKKSVSYR